MTGTCEGHECRVREAGGRAAGRTAAGYRLCGACHRRLTLGIRQLPDLYRDCEQVLGGASVKGLRERTSGGPLPGAPFNAAAAEARAAIMGVLGAWSGLVAQERRVAPPQRTIGTLSVFLLRHTDWLAGHPAAAEATREVARLVVKARRVAHPEQVRRIALGACVEPGCDGRLFGTVPVGVPGSHPAVRCDADPLHVWAGHQWTQLRRLIGGVSTANTASTASTAGTAKAADAAPAAAADRWLTATDISRLWNTPVGTVYRLASEQRWRRHHRSGRTYYSEADAHECFSRRAERSRQG
ncbi:hypothetical protein [Streptomyces sp.]|uniref:hypothetical protein n=1 Tax=Streptomyces sp. TaxID=1931 RepID=UPI002F425D00